MPEQPAEQTSQRAKEMAESTEYPGPRRADTGESVDLSNAQPDVTPGTSARGGRPKAVSAEGGAALGTPAAPSDALPPIPAPNDPAPHHAKTMRHGGDPGEDESSKPPR